MEPVLKEKNQKLVYTSGRNENNGEQYGGSLEKLQTELSYDPAIPFLGVYLEKTIIWKATYTSMVIECSLQHHL